MSETSERSGLQVDEHLRAFVEDELLAQVELTGEEFWSILARLQERFTPRIATALAERDDLQARIDAWHAEHGVGSREDYESLLTELGYLAPEPSPCSACQASIRAWISSRRDSASAMRGANRSWSRASVDQKSCASSFTSDSSSSSTNARRCSSTCRPERSDRVTGTTLSLESLTPEISTSGLFFPHHGSCPEHGRSSAQAACRGPVVGSDPGYPG